MFVPPMRNTAPTRLFEKAMRHPIAIEGAIHLCLDMQRLFAPGSVWSTPWMTRVTPNVVRIVETFGLRNVFTRFIPPMRPQDMPGASAIYAALRSIRQAGVFRIPRGPTACFPSGKARSHAYCVGRRD
jgi:nicotinamidase-related amidase